jgi:hypothetical protein
VFVSSSADWKVSARNLLKLDSEEMLLDIRDVASIEDFTFGMDFDASRSDTGDLPPSVRSVHSRAIIRLADRFKSMFAQSVIMRFPSPA